jgi:hypothetical protein
MSNSCETGSKPGSIKDYLKLKSFWISFAAVVLGGAGGFLYYYFVGCANGSCGITSNPYSSIVFGSVLGLFLTTRKCGC